MGVKLRPIDITQTQYASQAGYEGSIPFIRSRIKTFENAHFSTHIKGFFIDFYAGKFCNIPIYPVISCGRLWE